MPEEVACLMEPMHRELEEPCNPECERNQRKKMKKEHTTWSSTTIISMPDPATSKEHDVRAKRWFVEHFPDLDGRSAWNIS